MKKTKKELMEMYEKNFKILLIEAQKCSCWTHRGKKAPECTNPKHAKAIQNERKINIMCNKASEKW